MGALGELFSSTAACWPGNDVATVCYCDSFQWLCTGCDTTEHSVPGIVANDSRLRVPCLGCHVAVAGSPAAWSSNTFGTDRQLLWFGGSFAGMLSPLATVFYADWLQSVPTRYAVEARRFEPYRAQLVLWLVGLAFGLVMRLSMRSLQSPRDLNVPSPRAIAFTNPWSAEVLWLTVAGLVGVFALVSSGTDPQPQWPAFELGALSLVAVLSGCFSGQAWRGHIAAMLAGAACLYGMVCTTSGSMGYGKFCWDRSLSGLSRWLGISTSNDMRIAATGKLQLGN